MESDDSFLPAWISPECCPCRGCSCRSPGGSNWRLGGSGCQSPHSPGHPSLLWGVKAPRSGMVSPGHDNTLLRRLTVVQDGEQGMWCPLCGCLALLPALPSPSQRCVGLTGVGRWGGSEGLPSLGAWQENVVLSLGGSEGLQWAAHPPALQV